MSNALSEDLIILIVVNGEDKEFALQNLVKDKTAFRTFVTKEFFKYNSNSVLDDLRIMDDSLDLKMLNDKNKKSI